jgi:hypothetical protein
VGDDQCQRDEKQHDGREPERDVRGTRFDGGPEEVRNYDQQDLRKNQVDQAKLAAQAGAVWLDICLGGGESRVGNGRQGSFFFLNQSQNPRPVPQNARDKEGNLCFLFLF